MSGFRGHQSHAKAASWAAHNTGEVAIATHDLSAVQGIGPASLRRLSAAGIGSVEQLLELTAAEVASLLSFGEMRATAILDAARPLAGAADSPAAAAMDPARGPAKAGRKSEKKKKKSKKDKKKEKKKDKKKSDSGEKKSRKKKKAGAKKGKKNKK